MEFIVALTVAGIGAAAAITSAVIGFFAVRGVRANHRFAEGLGRQIDTENGSALGPTVHRMDQTLEFVATTVKAQGETLRAHGDLLGRGAGHFEDLDRRLATVADSVNDQRIEQEEFVAKVAPLLEQQQREGDCP
jgi:hypothetical protein